MFSDCKYFVIASLAGAATAHQNFHQFWVNDVSPGFEVAIRMPPSNRPVTDVTSNDMTCNVNGNTVPSGKTTAPAKAGDTIKVQWDSSDHLGPIQHYLFGPVADAASVTGIGSWFKIDELTSVNGTWASAMMLAKNMTHEFTLPKGLASGDYLLRSEMIALHAAKTLGGAQFYMGCAQLTITGTDTSSTCGPGIKLPGAYKEDDPSILIPNFYYGFDISTYTGPGGAVATCGPGSGNVASSRVVSSPAVSTDTVPSAVFSSSVAVKTSNGASITSALSSKPVASSAILTTMVTKASSAVAVSTRSASVPASVPVEEEDEDAC